MAVDEVSVEFEEIFMRLPVRVQRMAGKGHCRLYNGAGFRFRDVERPEVRTTVCEVGGSDAAAGLDAVERLAPLAEQPRAAKAGGTDREVA